MYCEYTEVQYLKYSTAGRGVDTGVFGGSNSFRESAPNGSYGPYDHITCMGNA